MFETMRLQIANKPTSEGLNSVFYRTDKLGDLEIDFETEKVSVTGRDGLLPLELTSIEFKILQALMQNFGKVRTQNELAAIIWDYSFFQSRTVELHIQSLRKKIELSTCQIQTVNQVQYRLVYVGHS